MSAELQQSATDVLSLSANAASATTISTGILTALSVLPQVFGCIASLVGIYVTVMLYRKKSRVYKLQEKDLEMHLKEEHETD